MTVRASDAPSRRKPLSKAPTSTAGNRYQQGTATRQPFLDRAIMNSELTDSSLFNRTNVNGKGSSGETLVSPWSSFGGYLVNNLNSKVALSIFPVGLSFIRLAPSRKVLEATTAMTPTDRGEAVTAIGLGLRKVEQELVDEISADGDAAILSLGLKRVIVGGTHCIEHLDNARIRGIPLDRFVCYRDGASNLLEFVIVDYLAWETLADDLKAMCLDHGHRGDHGKAHFEKSIAVYTHGKLKDGKWKIYQECWGQKVPDSEATYVPDAMPFDFWGINFLEGEDYSRAYVDLFVSDLQLLDGFTEIIHNGSAAAAILIRLVRPGSSVSKKALQEAANGDVLTGDAADVHTLDANKTADFRTAQEVRQEAMGRLDKAFLLNSSVQRNGDRVTGTEIRFVAQELNDGLGGVYMTLVNSVQKPYSEKKLRNLQRAARVTKFPKDQVRVTILTGAAALGRNAELNNLDALVFGASAQGGPPPPINWSNYYNRRAILLGQDPEGLILTEQEVMEQQKAAQQAQLVQGVAPEVVRQAGGMMQQQTSIEADAAAAEAQGATIQ